MRQIVIILLILTTGCATQKSWTTLEKTLLLTSCLAAGADAYTTVRGLEEGCLESNVFLGESPSTAQVVVFTGLFQIAVMVIAHYWPSSRNWLLGGKTLVNGGCAVWNSQQY